MEVSKLTLSEGLRDQTLATDVLLWMRDHFDKCKNTNCKKLAVTIGLDKDFKPHATTGSIDQTIHKLMRRGLVIRQGTNLWHSNFLVNHGHPDMPPIVDEGFIKVTSTKDDSPTAVFRRNGSKTLAQLIFEWMDAHPAYLVDTTAGEIATAIIKEGTFEGSYASIVSIIHRLMRDGRVKKFNKTDGYRSLADFKLVKKVIPMPQEPEKIGLSSNEVFRANGKTLAELIIDWMKDNPMHLKETTTGEMAEAIVADGKFQTTKESAQTIIARLVREGRVQKFMLEDRPRGRADFKVLDVKYEEPKEEISPDYEYETLKTNKTPEEEQEIMEDNVKNFKELVNEGMDPIHASILTEPKETSTTQAIKLADGSTVNLTININIGK